MQKSLRPGGESRTAVVIDTVVFYLLLCVIFLAAIPYGSVELWWKALFQCAIFALAGFSLVGQIVRGETTRKINRLDRSILVPLLVLIAFALIQIIPWSSTNLSGIGQIGRTLSADAFQTWLFTIHLVALVLIGWMLVIHTTTLHRLRVLVGLLISTGVLSAFFGIWRHASQREVGFVLPYLRPALGYGQFINPNHFAFLMEMALGLTLGVVVGRGVPVKRLVLYLLAAVPMWVALVLANSRGGVLSLICQVIFFALLLGSVHDSSAESDELESRWLRASRMFAVRAILVTVLLIGTIATVSYVGGDRMARRLESVPAEFDYQPEDTTTRQAIWRATWEMIKDHPIAGVGFGGYAVAIPKYHRASGEVRHRKLTTIISNYWPAVV